MQSWFGRGALGVVALPLLFMSADYAAPAADHFDPPTRVDPAVATPPDFAADLADLYVFQTATTLVIAMDFAGPQAANNPAVYDRNILYRIMVSNAGAKTDAEFTIEFQFGQDPTNPNASGIRITGIPGQTAPIIGPAETLLTQGNIKVMAGLFDDPFNFDVVGFNQTRNTGVLSIRNDRNRFFGLNSTGVVIEIPLTSIQNGSNPIAAWGTTARFMGTTP